MISSQYADRPFKDFKTNFLTSPTSNIAANQEKANHNMNFSHLRAHKHKDSFRPVVALSTAAGTVIPMVLMRNKKQTLFKSLWNFEYGVRSIVALGLGAIAGGVLGGIIEDKGKNTDKKLREGFYQSVANIIIPSILAHKGMGMLEKRGIKNKFAKSGVVIAAIGGGMLIGGHIINFINKRLFPHLPADRKIVPRDALIHIDDLPMALAFAKEKFLGIEKLVPIGALLSGYEAGIGRGHYHDKHQKLHFSRNTHTVRE